MKGESFDMMTVMMMMMSYKKGTCMCWTVKATRMSMILENASYR